MREREEEEEKEEKERQQKAIEGVGVQTSEIEVGEGGVGPERVRDVCRPLVCDAAVPNLETLEPKMDATGYKPSKGSSPVV